MTDPQPVATTAGTEPASTGDPYLLWLPGALQSGAIKSALSGADRAQTMDLAYPYLTRFINPDAPYANRRLDAMRAHAAVIARTGIRNTPGLTFGRVAYKISGPGGISPDSVTAMVHTIYKSPIRFATRTIEAILRVAANNNTGVDYQNLFDIYQWWDVNPTRPNSARRRFLNNFYIPPTTTPTNTDKEAN